MDSPVRRSPLRIAVVGLSSGRSHVRGLLEQRAVRAAEIELCAVCDVDRGRLHAVADAAGVAARYRDFARLLAAERPDAVVLSTPNDQHEPMALAALEAGCHLLLEPPLAASLQAARRIAEAARRARRRVVLHHPLRLDAAARTIKAYLASGRCGPLYHANTYACRARGLPTQGSWRTQRARAGGGAIVDLGVHRLDLTLWFMGDPEVRSAAAVTHRELGRVLMAAGRRQGARARFDVEEFGGGLLRLAGGRAIVFEVSWAENSGRREILLTRVLGLHGGAIHRNLDSGAGFSAELHADRGGRLVAPDARPFRRASLVPVQEFTRIVRGGGGLPSELPDAGAGLRVQRVLAAIFRSAREGREVGLAEVDVP